MRTPEGGESSRKANLHRAGAGGRRLRVRGGLLGLVVCVTVLAAGRYAPSAAVDGNHGNDPVSPPGTRFVLTSDPATTSRLHTALRMASLVSVPDSGVTIYHQHCTVCHGEEGRGDGPAAVGIRPPPADFTDPERVGDLSFEQMVGVVTSGKKYMPAFGSVLRPEQIRLVVAYVRTLVDSTAAKRP